MSKLTIISSKYMVKIFQKQGFEEIRQKGSHKSNLRRIHRIIMNNQNLIFKPFEEGQEYIVSELVWGVFKEFEAPDYSKEGIKTFKDFIVPQNIVDMVKASDFKIYCCFDNKSLIGVLALKDNTHIALLFVCKKYHRRGIAKELLKIALADISIYCPDASELTVNSSPYAVKIYERLGFFPRGKMEERDGIKFVPMKKIIQQRMTDNE